MGRSAQFILWFNEISIKDVPLVGGKNASLGEMYRLLAKKGVRIPNGFAITAHAYQYLLEQGNLREKIRQALHGLHKSNMGQLAAAGRKVRELILAAEFPDDLRREIAAAYRKLSMGYRSAATDVAVRSSATAEDLPDASFAGQQETYLNVAGEHELLDSCRKCFASLFTNRAISYREDKGFDHFQVSLSIGVQKMVRADLASAGVMFSIDTETGFKNAVFITAIYGLGENIVQGAVNPDEYYVFKPTLGKYRPILSKTVGDKKIKMVYSDESKHPTKNVVVPPEDRERFVLADDEILLLARWAVLIERHYGKPMDMEWAKDGRTGQLFIVQARPETVMSRKPTNIIEAYRLSKKGEIIAAGKSVGSKIGSGKANIIKDAKDIGRFSKGEVLVTDMTDPDWEPIMKIASAIVTNRGGRTCFDGKAMVLTNQGFLSLAEIYENGHAGLVTLSFNKSSKKIEWKPILASMKRKAQRIRVSVSPSGRIADNYLTLTPNHQMVNVRNAQLVDTEIGEMIDRREMLCVAQKVPSFDIASERDQRLAYLLGGIMTDGSIYRSRTHGEVQFIQKNIPEKEAFIAHMQACMGSVYHKQFAPVAKPISSGMIRGKAVRGQATAYRLYSKQVAYAMYDERQGVVQTLLRGGVELCYHFLAGVVDGDGSFHNNRVQIYISNERLLQAVVVACLKIGMVPQVTRNRNIYNVQLVEDLGTLMRYTRRVAGKVRARKIKTRFFGARQLSVPGTTGELKLRAGKNLYISAEELQQLDERKFYALLQSDLRMQRVIDTGLRDYGDVYNITVADNHTYVIFTEKLTPVIVNNCHAAIISRELGIPCVVGTTDGTRKIPHGAPITVSCAQGEDGYVYRGLIPFTVLKTDVKSLRRPKTRIMMNMANPEQAFELSFIPNDGVGLAREEFIINEYIKIHPNALLHYSKIADPALREQIDAITRGYADKVQFFIDKLASGIAMIGAAFWPNPVIVRFSDFKTNEYANLIGGSLYEPKEENPMIGWRGASRYYSPGFQDAFALECRAIKKVREAMGLRNVVVMVPFCRTVDEGKRVLAEMRKNGLVRGKNGLEVYVMCEIPANVVLADEFSGLFDGFSIGSNDLTQLTLGLDRDSAIVSELFDERNDAVRKMVALVIHKAKKNKRKIGICGDAPSTFPEFAEFLVRCGIDSISLSPDAVIKTTIAVHALEQRLHH